LNCVTPGVLQCVLFIIIIRLYL